MEIEEPLINELLLVGAALGSTETFTAEDGSLVERFIRGENCLEWLQDLQRALRRDDEATRAVSVRLGSWRVVETKLLPLLLECRDDLELVVTLAKIFVMLTMPLSPTARKWARFQVDARDAAEMGGTEAARRRAAARAQVKHMLAMKRAFVQVAGGEAVAALVGAMEEPLARGARRTEADTLIIELVLTLFRNLLCIEDVCRGLAAAGGEEGQSALGGGDGVDDRLLHQELLVLLDREYVLEVVLCLCQGVQARENQPWNLLLMEIVFHLLRGHDAADVAAAGPPPPREGDEEDGDGMEENRDPATRLPMTTPAPPGSKARGGGNALSALLQQERLARAAVVQKAASRHSRFGGGLLLAGFDGKATRLVTNPFKDALSSLPQARRKRTRRGAAVFASDGLMGAAGGGAHELEGGVGSLLLPKGAPDPLTLRARKALHGFCRQLVEGGGYEPFIKSLKNEFRRDSSRLEPGDRIVFFRIVGFVLAFHRFLCLHAAAAGKKSARPDWAGALIHSMDVLSFNLVLSTIDGLVAAKGYGDLVHAVALYKEMVGLLATLAGSSNEAYRNIAVGLQHKLFYASEPVDKLHKVGACWKPGLFPRRFLADVLGLCEAQMRLLEANAAKAQDEEALKKESNAVIRDMLAARKRFDLDRYFASLCTNQMVRMATHLLEQYLTNPPYVTLDVLTFFQRMRDFDLERRQQRHRGRKGDAPENDEAEEAGREKQTLEPMLFNVHTLGVLQTVLDDKRIAHEPRFVDLLAFAKSVVRHFGRMATRNPLLLVEALFQHPFPHTFCATLQQGYCQSHTLESVAVAAKDLNGEEEEEEGEGAAKPKGGKGKGKALAAKKGKKRDDFIVSDSDEDGEADYEGEDESDEGNGGGSSSGSSEGEENAEEAAAAAAAQGIDPAAYAAQKQSQRLRRKQQKREEARRRAAEEERRRLAALEEDSEDEWDGMLPAAPESGASSSDSDSSASGGKAKKKRDKPAKAPGAAARRRGAARWDIKEDATLRREYAKYKDSASCFYVLAAMGPLGEKGRTAEQVKRRLRFLKLLDPAAGAGKDKAAGKKEKKQKKGSGSSSSSSSDSSSSSSSSSSESEGGKSRGSSKAVAGGGGSVASTSPAKSPAREAEAGEASASASASAAAPSPAPAPAPAGRRRIRKKAAESSSESSDDVELDILG